MKVFITQFEYSGQMTLTFLTISKLCKSSLQTVKTTSAGVSWGHYKWTGDSQWVWSSARTLAPLYHLKDVSISHQGRADTCCPPTSICSTWMRDSINHLYKTINEFTSIFLTISKPSITFPEKVKKNTKCWCTALKETEMYFSISEVFVPKTTCFASNQWQLAQVMKNWHPFVPGPLFAYMKTQNNHKRRFWKQCLS